MTKKRSEIFVDKSRFFPKKFDFFEKKFDFFPGKVRFFRKIFTNLTWGFFSGPSRVFDFFRVATLVYTQGLCEEGRCRKSSSLGQSAVKQKLLRTTSYIVTIAT